MAVSVQLVLAVVLCYGWRAAAEQCRARVHTDAGWVCGTCAPSGDYASFLAVPYATQPLGELRFQELPRPVPWEGCLDATKPGPICPQRDLFYGAVMRTTVMREDCIHANIHMPLKQLGARNRTLLPVLVHVHGGGFGFGSGDPDLHGPQYLVRENVVVITFNYRLGPFGFLSLNSTVVPGNAGLRDIVTLLRWVQRNAASFGGDPNDVTLTGQSAGAGSAHLLSLSKAAEGLFKRVILMSGAGSRGFFTTSPVYAQDMAQRFLKILDINNTDPEEVHRQLVAMPFEWINEAHNNLQDVTGLVVFTPVIESTYPDVEAILDDDPEILQDKGRGSAIPFIIGFTNAECETFRPRFETIDMVGRIEQLPALVLPPGVIYTTPTDELDNKIEQVAQRYFNGTSTSSSLDKFLKLCSDSYFVYPALKVAEARAANGGAPVYLYEFAYEADYSVFKEALNLKYRGAGHSEDLTFVFRANHVLAGKVLSSRDSKMADFMTRHVTNFMRYSDPSIGIAGWPPVEAEKLQYQKIVSPELASTEVSGRLRAMMKFFDGIYKSQS